jgi:Zinc finger, C2H2 type
MKARNSLGRSISLLNDVEPPRQSPKALLRTMSDSTTPFSRAPLPPVSTYQSDAHPQSPPELLRTESSGSSIRRTPSPPTPCTADDVYSHQAYRRGTELLEKLPYPSPLHQRDIGRSYSEDSEWLLSPPASPHPLNTPSLVRLSKKRDVNNAGAGPPTASPVSPRQEDVHWSPAEAPKPDKRRYTWSPPPVRASRLSLPVRNRVASGSPPTDAPASPTQQKDRVVVQVNIDSNLQEGARPRRRYACPVGMCVKTFSTSGHASRHAKTHEGRREHVCGECFKRFGRKDNMRQHMTTHAAHGSVAHERGSGSTKRRKSYGPAGDVPDGGLPPVPEPSGMDLLAAAAAAAAYPAVGELTLS